MTKPRTPKDLAFAAAKSVWRRMPVDLRRAVAEQLLYGAAPRLPEPDPASLRPDAPRIVVGLLSSPSGLGQAARLTMRSYAARGLDVYGVDLSHAFFENAGAIEVPYPDGRNHRGPARVLIKINAPYLPYVFKLLGRDFLAQKHITAFWAWETPRAPDDWRRGLSFAHEIAAPSQFVARAIAPLAPERRIIVAPYPVALDPDLPTLPPRTRPVSETDPFTVVSSLNVASGFERKNPTALVRAFRTAFQGRRDRRLRLLVSNVERHPPARGLLEDARGGDDTVEITYATFDRAGYWTWHGRPDMFASLHRAEGFGLGLAESMLMGVATLATDWSANAEWIDAETGYPVACRQVPIADSQRKYEPVPSVTWADPDEADAVRQFRTAADDDVTRLHRVAAAQIKARKIFSTFAPEDVG